MDVPHYRRGTDDDRWVIPELVHQDMYRAKALAGREGTILDCGAHIGVFSVLLAAHGVRQPIEAFEPEPANFDLLVKNAAPYPTITPRQLAVGRRDEERLLHDGGETGRWSFVPPAAGRAGVRVPVIDLYRHVRELGRVPLLKFDLEGYEAELLNNMPDDVLGRIDLLLTEEHHLPIDHARLAAAGFELWFHPRHDHRQRVYRAARRPTRAIVPADAPSSGAASPSGSRVVVWRRSAGEAEGLVGRPWGTRCPAAELLPAGAARVLDLTGTPGSGGNAAVIAEAVVGDPEAEGFDPGAEAFDALLCGRLLERARDPAALLRRARGWLRPGGCLLARIGNARHHTVLRALLDGTWGARPEAPGERGRLRYFTRREVEKLFFRAGFALEDLRAVPPPGGRGGDVSLGNLLIRGLPAEAREEFFTRDYLVRAALRPPPDFGLTSVVLLTHNQLGYTRQCLDSIRHCTDEPYEVIVVDNASTDGTPEYLNSLGGLTLIRNDANRGFPAGANQGMRAARGRQVLLLNNDTVVTTGWLRRMLDALHSDPAVGLVGPCSNLVSGEQQVPADYDADLVGLDGFAWDRGKAHDRRREDTDRLVGFCLLIRREVIDKVGLLDERFGVGCFEDDDYCLRALRAGYRAVIARDAFVHHYGGRTFVGDRVDYDALIRKNRELYRQKWAGGGADGAAAKDVAVPAAPPSPAGPRVLVLAHLDRFGGRMDKSHYYRYEALGRRPGVTLFGPGVEGYRPGMSVREAVAAACGGAWPDVILHGADFKESGVPLVTGLEDAPVLTAIELLDSWTQEERQAAFINRHRFAVGLIQEAGPHLASYRLRCPGTEFFWAPNAVNTALFHNRGLAKEYELTMGQSDEEILDTLRRHLADKDRLRAMTEAVHRRVITEHSTEAFAGRTLNLFRELLAKRKAPAATATACSVPEIPSAPAPAAGGAKTARFTVRAAPGGGLLLQRNEVRLTLCMIVRDNAKTIGACLGSVRPWVDEMVVVDTGSEDGTPRVAAGLGARVFHFPWCDSFSAARNESLRHAWGRWVFWMDSDDTISAENGRKLRALADREPPPGVLGYVMQVHCPGPGDDGDLDMTVVDHVKLFRNLPHLRFVRKTYASPRSVSFNVHGFRLAVNRETCEIDILQSVHAADAGTVMNPLQCTGQIEGGVAQGIGWSMIENMFIDQQGAVTNPTLRNYRIPAFADIPRTEVYFATTTDTVGPMGAKPMSESPVNPVAAAMANALADATGIRFAKLPFTPPRLFEQMRSFQKVESPPLAVVS